MDQSESDVQSFVKLYPEEPDVVIIPAGSFRMGSDQAALQKSGIHWWDWMAREMPEHWCHLPTYAIGRYPLTNQEYARFMADDGYQQRQFWTTRGWQRKNRYQWTGPRYWHNDHWNQADHPVVGVSWYECVAYCGWLAKISGRPYRLPTEAEWEKAARGLNARIWPWGNHWDQQRCNNWEIERHSSTPVGSYSPNGDSPFGAADMVGNVWEWCATQWDKPYPYDTQEDEWQRAYLEGSAVRVLRGGSWGCVRNLARCAYRESNNPALRFSDRGCRIVLASLS